jgi:hypothetical protein
MSCRGNAIWRMVARTTYSNGGWIQYSLLLSICSSYFKIDSAVENRASTTTVVMNELKFERVSRNILTCFLDKNNTDGWMPPHATAAVHKKLISLTHNPCWMSFTPWSTVSLLTQLHNNKIKPEWSFPHLHHHYCLQLSSQVPRHSCHLSVIHIQLFLRHGRKKLMIPSQRNYNHLKNHPMMTSWHHSNRE